MSGSEETIWDPVSSLGRVMPPSDFVLDSSQSSFSQTKKPEPTGRGRTFTTSLSTTNPNTYMKFIFLRTSPLTWHNIWRFSSSQTSQIHSKDMYPWCEANVDNKQDDYSVSKIDDEIQISNANRSWLWLRTYLN